MLNSIIILAIIVLPGWLSISAAQLHHPRLIDRTGVMLWGMLFYHTIVVHAIGVALFALPIYFSETLSIYAILTADAYIFGSGVTLAMFGIYFLWLVIFSIFSGVADLPAKITYYVGRLLRKIKLAPNEPFPDEPVWFGALHLARIESGKKNIHVSIRMKNGDVYVGALVYYPVDLPDSTESKDIRLGDSVLYPNGDESSPIHLKFTDFGGGGVLLNTANISSIQYLFHDDYEDDNNI